MEANSTSESNNKCATMKIFENLDATKSTFFLGCQEASATGTASVYRTTTGKGQTMVAGMSMALSGKHGRLIRIRYSSSSSHRNT